MAFSKSSIGVPPIGGILREFLPDRSASKESDNSGTLANSVEESVEKLDTTRAHSAEHHHSKETRESREQREPKDRIDPDEATLVIEAQQNPDMFGILYERYVDRVYAYIYHRVGNAQDAEDLTARTFYRALSRINSYENRGFPFSAWLFRIAHNLVANWHRDHGKRRFLSLDRLWSHSREEELPERHVETSEKHNALWDAINRLPEDRRDLLIYKFSSRLSNVEIGELMNKSESAIKSLYFRTLAALRNDLESRNWEK